MKDLASGTFIEKLPQWLRWILVIPSSILAPFLFLIIQAFSLDFFAGGTTDGLWFKIIRELVWGGGFVFAGAYIAPKKQFLVSVILLILISIFVGVSILLVLMGYASISPIESIIGYILNLVAAAGVVYYIHNEILKKENENGKE